MSKEKRNHHFYSGNLSSPVQSRPSLFKTLAEVKRQISYETLGKRLPEGTIRIDPIYNELCLIIAEMYIRPLDSIVKIQGEEIAAATVQEVYRELQADHIELVADRFKQQTALIHRKKAYLQTALYNVLFEIDSHYSNLVNHDRYGL